MQRLLQFLYTYRVFVVFVLLQGICSWIIVKNNNYHGSKFFNTSNQMAASMVASADYVSTYFGLRHDNIRLAEENARLREQLKNLVDSIQLVDLLADSSTLGIKAKVIDNSLFFRNNYLVVNRGEDDGVTKGMGVIGPDGIVGQVQRTSAGYATVVSVLHGESLISAKHGPSNTLGTVVWTGDDHRIANLQYVPRHVRVDLGDSVWTSGYNSVFPEQSLIGTVKSANIDPDATFYDIEVDLATDFGSLDFVYLMRLEEKEAIDSLRNEIKLEHE